MAGRTAIIFMAALFAATSVAAQDKAPAVPDKVKAQIEACDTYKFETSAKVTVDGKPRRMRVKLCGVEADNDADWVRTLRDAIEKVETNDRFPAEAKEQIVTALKAEIAKYPADEPAQAILDVPLSRPSDIATPRAPAQVGPPVEYSALPPLPAPLPAKPAVTPARPEVTPAGLPPRPRLNVSCYNPGDIGSGGPCATLVRETVITVKAKEALAGGHSLRFLRRGDPQGEVALAEIRKGRSVRVGVPRQLCSGVTGSRVELQVVHGGRVLDTLGPYELRC